MGYFGEDYNLRYENDRGEFLLVLRHLPDGSKQVLDDKGRVTRTLARGESLSMSKRDRARLVLGDPARVDLVKRIFRMYAAEGKGYKAIADTLNREKVPAPRGSAWASIYTGHWADSSVRAILINPLYPGDMVWNRRTDGRFHKISRGRAVERTTVHGARLVPNETSDWIVVRATHPALVSRDLFERARQLREDRPGSKRQRGKQPVGGWHGARSRFILSGIVVCRQCGNRYQGCTRQKGQCDNNGVKVKTFYYACGGYIRGGNSVCAVPMIKQDVLEGAVLQTVSKFYAPFLGEGGRARLEAAVRAQQGNATQDLAKARRRILEDQSRLERVINNLLDNITKENRAFVEKRLGELSQKRDALNARLDQIHALSSSRGEVARIVREAEDYLGSLGSVLKGGVPEEKKVALRRCVERVEVDNGSHQLVLHIRKIPTLEGRSEEVVVAMEGNRG